MMNPIGASVRKLETAIIGDDLSSGLVSKVNAIDSKFATVVQFFEAEIKERKEKEENLRRWRLALIASTTTIVGIFIGQILSFLLHL